MEALSRARSAALSYILAVIAANDALHAISARGAEATDPNTSDEVRRCVDPGCMPHASAC